jgi:hypothetical protein
MSGFFLAGREMIFEDYLGKNAKKFHNIILPMCFDLQTIYELMR